eukprot:CAMPEP_0202967734 /NCGR_PEP_ID=MMETSP1396-20130829/12730_1 /ASSEMBLY_ACC=CAM_ASM_000872 /TAXON_ID= /ORGANISM="Pseudokeronopsis sp., Strain Brazil" /LENGTH=49 /DNA_ID= /DNA_START= /DNA_END= /DNA_ORIENTATION=
MKVEDHMFIQLASKEKDQIFLGFLFTHNEFGPNLDYTLKKGEEEKNGLW